MEERAEDPSFDSHHGDARALMSSHFAFRKKNSGRLVSKFLRSFLDRQGSVVHTAADLARRPVKEPC
jgi:hypothetical protein